MAARLLRAIAVLVLVGLGAVLPTSAAAPAGKAQDQKRAGSILYTGRGHRIKSVSFRLKGHQLIEARLVVIESCSVSGGGHGRRYHWRAVVEEASPRWPLRVDGRGRFHYFRSEVYPSSDEYIFFVGRVRPRSIVGRFTYGGSESAPESGVFNNCHTGPFGGPREELSFHARRR